MRTGSGAVRVAAGASDAALATRARAGDAEAFGALYERHAPGVYDFLARLLRDRVAAEDLTQTTFLRAFERRETLRDPARVRSWLYATAHNLAMNQLGRSRPTESLDQEHEPVSPAAGPDEEAAVRETAALVWSAAASLEPRQYAVLDLSVRRGLSSPEVAEALAVDAGHAAVLVHRAHQALAGAVRDLLVARRREECPRLAELLPTVGVALTAEQRRTVDRHLRGCPTCSTLGSRLTEPTALYGALAPLPLPASLDPRAFTTALARGFPRPASTAGPAHRAVFHARSLLGGKTVAVAAVGVATLAAAGIATGVLATRSGAHRGVAAGGSASSTAPSSPPVVTSITPSVASAGTLVTIHGAGFGRADRSIGVGFFSRDGKLLRARVRSWTPTEVVAAVPAALPAGRVPVVVWNHQLSPGLSVPVELTIAASHRPVAVPPPTTAPATTAGGTTVAAAQPAPAPVAGRAVSICGAQLTQPGRYVLAGDLGPCPGDGIDVVARDVLLDLGGHHLSGSGTGRGGGVWIHAGATGAAVEDGTVTGFGTGIEDDAANTSLLHLTASANLGVGIFLVGARSAHLSFDTLSQNGRFGLYLQRTSASIAQANTIVASGIYGVFLQSSTLDTIAHNTIDGSGLAGVYAGCSNAGPGSGAACPPSRGDTIEGNRVGGRPAYGIALDAGQTENLVHGNMVSGARRFDLEDANTGCRANGWSGDSFHTANPLCLR